MKNNKNKQKYIATDRRTDGQTDKKRLKTIDYSTFSYYVYGFKCQIEYRIEIFNKKL